MLFDSLPSRFIERMQRLYGADTAAVLAQEGAPARGLRVNTLKCTVGQFRRLWRDTFCFVHSVQEDRLAVFWRTVLAFRQYIPGLAVCWRQRSSLFR